MNTRYYLRLQAAKGIGTVTQRAVLRYVADQGIDLLDFFALPSTDWRKAGLSAKQVESLVLAEDVAAKWESELSTRQIQVFGWLDEAYPKRLKQVLQGQAPPILHAWGNLDLLDGPSIGFGGSRKASSQGIGVAKDTAQQVAKRGWTVVSGHARGIDLTAHQTALENGGATIIVAPEGILNFRLRKQLKPLVLSDNVLVLSEFHSHARWSVANAMTRNHTICALSNALVVVEAGLKGGTFAAAQFALGIDVPLFVVDYAQPSENALGNRYFIQRGAQPVRRHQKTGRANLTRLFNKVASDDIDPSTSSGHRSDNPPISTPTQMSLFALNQRDGRDAHHFAPAGD